MKLNRRSVASKFGACEHWAGRFVGIGLIIYYWIFRDPYILAILILWFIYFISHNFEKMFYGKGLR